VGAFQQALHALQRLPEGRDTIEQAIDLRLDMRNALLALGDVRAMFDALREAETLARAIDDHRRLGRVSFYMIEYFRMVGDYDRAIASGQQALALAESLSDFGTQVVTNAFLGNVYYARGDQHRAIEVLQKVVTALTGDLTREHFGLMGFQAWALRLLGEIASQSDPPEIESAEIYYRQALTLAEELGMRPLQAHGHYSLGTLYLTLGQREQARAALSTAIDLHRAMEMTFWLPQAEAMLAQVKD